MFNLWISGASGSELAINTKYYDFSLNPALINGCFKKLIEINKCFKKLWKNKCSKPM